MKWPFRSITPQPSTRPPDFGLVAWLEATRISLPLKGVDCRFEVTGAVASVEMDQIFHQDAREPLDCTYQFPLPAGSAVYRCEMHVNGRVIRARVESKEEARRQYAHHKASGQRAAMVETERENVFTLSLGNVQPGDVVVVRFAWFQVLDRVGNDLRLLVPTCPGVRYIPGQPLLRSNSGRGIEDDTDQVPDASRLTPPRIDDLHSDAAYFALSGHLSSADVVTATLTSPTHPVRVRAIDSTVRVDLAVNGVVPDRDFVLAWREPAARQLAPLGWHWVEGEYTYAMVQLRAPEATTALAFRPQEYYFLIDRSGSMEGTKWTRTCEALRAVVGLLGQDDRVWITLFESTAIDFAEVPLPAPQVLADRGFQRMVELGVAGGTELLPAARRVLEQIARHSVNRPACVILITDGEVGNEEAIKRAFGEAPHVRLHAFGIDTTVNDAFLKSLARQQRGTCCLQTPNDDIAGTITSLGGRLRHPVLTDLRLSGPWEAPCETWPDLHAGEVVTVALRGTGTSLPPPVIIGHSADGHEHTLAVDTSAAGSEAVKLLFVRERITALLATDHPQDAIALAREHTLLCKGASFVAWDEAEQVPVAYEEVIQPSMSPGRVLFSRSPSPAPGSSSCQTFFSRAAPSVQEDVPPMPLFFSQPSGTTGRGEALDRARSALASAGVPEALIETWLAWADDVDSLAESRAEQLYQTARLFDRLRAQAETQALRDSLARALHRTQSRDPENFLHWVWEAASAFDTLPTIRQRLIDAQTPVEIADALCAWVLEPARVDHHRLQALDGFTARLLIHLDSPPERRLLWEDFLEFTLSQDGCQCPLVSRWFEATFIRTEAHSPNPSNFSPRTEYEPLN